MRSSRRDAGTLTNRDARVALILVAEQADRERGGIGRGPDSASTPATRIAPSGNTWTSFTSGPDVPLFSFAEFCRMVGFEDVRAFEEKWQDVLHGRR